MTSFSRSYSIITFSSKTGIFFSEISASNGSEIRASTGDSASTIYSSSFLTSSTTIYSLTAAAASITSSSLGPVGSKTTYCLSISFFLSTLAYIMAIFSINVNFFGTSTSSSAGFSIFEGLLVGEISDFYSLKVSEICGKSVIISTFTS